MTFSAFLENLQVRQNAYSNLRGNHSNSALLYFFFYISNLDNIAKKRAITINYCTINIYISQLHKN